MEVRKLNTLRGLAALLVVLAHYWGVLDAGASRGSGQYGVMLFFLLSGFLMALLYLGKPFSLPGAYRFAVARLARVGPLFLVVVLVSYGCHQVGVGEKFAYGIRTGSDLLSHLLMLSGKSVLWTIPPEIQFYFLFLLFWKLYSLHPHYLWISFGALFAGGVLIDFSAYSYSPLDIRVDTRLISALPFFLVGVLLGDIYRRSGESPLQHRLFMLPLLLLPLLAPSIAEALFGRTWRLWQDLGPLVLVSAVFAAMVFLVPRGDRLLENWVGDFLGRVSYSLYLLHMPVLILLEPLAEAAPLLTLVLFLAISLLLAQLSFQWLEQPSRRYLRDRLGGMFGRSTSRAPKADAELMSN